MPCDCISVMTRLGYKSCLPESRHAAVCTMHERPWCLRTSSSVSQGHWGTQWVSAKLDLPGEGANITGRVTICKQRSDTVCLQLQTFPGHRCPWEHSFTTPASPRMRCGVYTTLSSRGESVALLTPLKSVWAQDLALQPSVYSRLPCIPWLGHAWAYSSLYPLSNKVCLTYKAQAFHNYP